jgi:endonuclease/exonuclease/phosphatase (EEP) superfamily protein YafD
MVGDFNVSPWSVFYKQFALAFGDRLQNVAKGLLPTYTWSLWDKNVLVSHIDHVFSSASIGFSEFMVGDLNGSDHNPIIFDIFTRPVKI